MALGLRDGVGRGPVWILPAHTCHYPKIPRSRAMGVFFLFLAIVNSTRTQTGAVAAPPRRRAATEICPQGDITAT